MKQTLEFLLQQIVDKPKSVSVDESVDGSKTLLTVHVDKDDMGKVIGKQGRIIRAIRDLVKIIAAKRNAFVDVVLAET